MSKFEVLVVLPPTPPDRYREELAARLAPYRIDLEVPEYRDHAAERPQDEGWVRGMQERGVLPDRDGLGWAEVAETVNRKLAQPPGDPNHVYVDEAGRGYFLSTRNPRGEWDYYSLHQQDGPYLLHLPAAAGDPRLLVHDDYAPDPERDRLHGLPHRCDGGPRGLLDFEALREARARIAGQRHDEWAASGGPRPDWPFPFTPDRAENIALARASALPGYALLRMDGSWTDIRRRGDSAAYWQETNDHLDALDPDAVVLAVACHS